jgi:hypothetical protein
VGINLSAQIYQFLPPAFMSLLHVFDRNYTANRARKNPMTADIAKRAYFAAKRRFWRRKTVSNLSFFGNSVAQLCSGMNAGK